MLKRIERFLQLWQSETFIRSVRRDVKGGKYLIDKLDCPGGDSIPVVVTPERGFLGMRTGAFDVAPIGRDFH